MRKLFSVVLFLFSSIYSFSQDERSITSGFNRSIELNDDLKSKIAISEVLFFAGNGITIDSIENIKKSWQVITLNSRPTPVYMPASNECWLLIKFDLKGVSNLNRDINLIFHERGSANKIYWDETILWENGNREGKRGSSEMELKLSIPRDKSSDGQHRMLVKITANEEKYILFPSGIEAGFSDFFIEQKVRNQYLSIFIMTIFLTSGVFYIVLFFGFNRNPAYLIFSVFCILNSFGVFEKPPWLLLTGIGDEQPYGGLFSFIVYIITCITLLLYFQVKYSFFNTKKIISLIVVGSPAVFLFLPELYFVIAVYSLSVLINLYALYKKKEGAYYIITGLIGFIILFYLQVSYSLWNGYFLGGIFFVLTVSILSSREIASQVKKHRQAVIRTARLENELLKKNIHPHFIMNTLMSLQEVVEQSPARASQFIQALSDEFQMFSKISDEKLVSVEDEFKLCRAHLQIMEFRKESKFELVTDGFDGSEKIPPGIFHTLIENGTTHGYINKRKGIFSITKIRMFPVVKYVVFNDSECEKKNEEITKGTGIRYVEARLEESYTDAWKLSFKQKENGFEAVIEIPDIEGNK